MSEFLDIYPNRKADLRCRMRAVRDGMPPCERARQSELVCEAIAGMPEFLRADVVFVYAAFASELDLHAIFLRAFAAGKVLAFPRCARKPGGEPYLEWFLSKNNHDLDFLLPGAYGILEPDPAALARADLRELDATRAFAVVPGLAFDVAGARLGYGGGYYDRFLTQFSAFSVGASYTQTLLEDLGCEGALEPHDVRLNALASPAGILRV